MALPSSGLIDFSDVRVETSQSAFTSYAFSGWAAGENGTPSSGLLSANNVYSPINLLSSGSRYKESTGNIGTKQLAQQNLSMSAWYSYDHTAAIGTDTTGSLYKHVNDNFGCNPSSMISFDVGTAPATLSLNISGTNPFAINPELFEYAAESYAIYYGKPWSVNGNASNYLGTKTPAYYPAGTTVIASGSLSVNLHVTRSIEYNYTYNVDSGSYIYYVIYGYGFCFCGGAC